MSGIDPDDAQAALAARRELGPAYEKELAESFADRVEGVIAERTAAQGPVQRRPPEQHHDGGARQMVLGVVSVGAGIPITAIAASTTHLPGLIVAWAGIVGVNVAGALAGRRRD